MTFYWMAAACVVLALARPIGLAATLDLTPVADASLIEDGAENNNGAQRSWTAGTTQNYWRNRALVRFDVRASVPSNALITSAELVLTVVRQPRDGFTPSTFTLHRVLRNWGEGDSFAFDNGGGRGGPATSNAVTWTHRFFATTNTWSQPGGEVGVDFLPEPSAEQLIYGVGQSPYSFGPEVPLALDCQFWLNQPEANFGWMLLSQAEGDNFTARLFASREDPSFPPLLRLAYVIRPVINSWALVPDGLTLRFEALPDQLYDIQAAPTVDYEFWPTITNLPPVDVAGPVEVTVPRDGATVFYRVGVRPRPTE